MVCSPPVKPGEKLNKSSVKYEVDRKGKPQSTQEKGKRTMLSCHYIHTHYAIAFIVNSMHVFFFFFFFFNFIIIQSQTHIITYNALNLLTTRCDTYCTYK